MKGRGVIMDCTPGLVYDPELSTCREKKNIMKRSTKLKKVIFNENSFLNS